MIITNNNTNLPIDVLKITKMQFNKVKVQFEL